MIGIFLEPNKPLKNIIIKWKKNLKKKNIEKIEKAFEKEMIELGYL